MLAHLVADLGPDLPFHHVGFVVGELGECRIVAVDALHVADIDDADNDHRREFFVFLRGEAIFHGYSFSV
jgi:hypothetical protein